MSYIKHHVPNHPHYFNIESWEKFYREDLHRIYRRIINYLKTNNIEKLFKNINYGEFIEYMFVHSDKYKIRER